MKKMSLLVPAAVAGVLLSAMVLAAPQTGPVNDKAPQQPNRADAYFLAIAS